MGPIDYTMNVQSPFEAALSGFKAGAGIAEYQAKALQARQQMEQQRLVQGRIQALMEKDNPTVEDFIGVAMLLPEKEAESMRRNWETLSKERQQNDLRFAGQIMSALSTNPEIGVRMLRERAEAERNAGREDQAKAYETYAQIAEMNPKLARNNVGIMLAALPGAKDLFESIKQFNVSEGYEIVSPAQAKELGLPEGGVYQRNTNTGKIEVLSGTGNRYEILSRGEAARLGLPGDAAYQREIGTGKITAIGSGGVKINLPNSIQVGEIPKDYKLVYDAQGRPSHMEVIPGSKTARELEKEAEAGASRAEGTVTTSKVVLDEIGRLRGMIKNEKLVQPITGITGEVASKIPGSMRRSAQGLVDTIRANIGFDRLAQMRAESPTGGALGNITEQELAYLQSVLGTINLDQNPKTLLENLDRLEKLYQGILKKAAAYPNAAKYGFVSPTTAGGSSDSTATTSSSNSRSGRVESVTINGKTYARPANFTDQQWAAYKKAMGVE